MAQIRMRGNIRSRINLLMAKIGLRECEKCAGMKTTYVIIERVGPAEPRGGHLLSEAYESAVVIKVRSGDPLPEQGCPKCGRGLNFIVKIIGPGISMDDL